MASSVGPQVLCQAFQASDCLFSILDFKTHRNTKTGLEKDIPFSCD